MNCLECDKGPSIYDIRHNFVADAVYELPFGRGKSFLNSSGAIDKVAGGWQISSIGLWHTGHPLTVGMDPTKNNIDPTLFNNSAFTQSFSGFPYSYFLANGDDRDSQRPDLIPGVPLILHNQPRAGNGAVPYINPAAFQAPPVDPNGGFLRFGNEPNGVIRALDSWQVDFALTKQTRLTERTTLEFAVQAFNIFNHVQLGDPGNLTLAYQPTATNLQALTPGGGFGQITSTVNFNNNNDNKASPNTGTGLPRQLQFMVRVKF